MLFFKKRKEAIKKKKEWEKSIGVADKVTVKHEEGLTLGRDVCELFLGENMLFIKTFMGDEFTINNDQLEFSHITQDKELVTKIKSSIGKALVGGALFGNVGAIIGGMPKSKEKIKETHYFLTIGYIDKDNKEKIVVFQNDKILSHYSELERFSSNINSLKENNSVKL